MFIRTPMLAATLLAMLCGHASAAVTLQGTRIVFDGSRNATTITAANQGERPALTQAWVDDGDINARAGSQKLPFVLTPTVRRLEAGARQNYRLTYAPAAGAPLPDDRESVLYFNLLDIPPKPENTEGQSFLQFAVRTRVKLFYRPKGLRGSPADAAAGLAWAVVRRNDGPALEVHNPSVFHVSFNDITLPGGETVTADMIAPGKRETIALPAGVPLPSSLTFTWLDDYGAIREQQARPAQ